jgi:hypothetical protein
MWPDIRKYGWDTPFGSFNPLHRYSKTKCQQRRKDYKYQVKKAKKARRKQTKKMQRRSR